MAADSWHLDGGGKSQLRGYVSLGGSCSYRVGEDSPDPYLLSVHLDVTDVVQQRQQSRVVPGLARESTLITNCTLSSNVPKESSATFCRERGSRRTDSRQVSGALQQTSTAPVQKPATARCSGSALCCPRLRVPRTLVDPGPRTAIGTSPELQRRLFEPRRPLLAPPVEFGTQARFLSDCCPAYIDSISAILLIE